MNISEQDINIILQDTVRQKTDTTHLQVKSTVDSAVISDTVPVKKVLLPALKEKPAQPDITAVSRRPVPGLTFYDTSGVITEPGLQNRLFFPFTLIEKNQKRESEARKILIKHLKEGLPLPVRPFHDDWIILILILSALLFSLIRTFSKRFVPEFTRFFFFRGLGEPASRDIAALFHWHSTLTNLISFFGIALFSYCAGLYYDLLPHGVTGFLFWLICFGVVIVSITLRHITCYLAGTISGQADLFGEYIITVYHSYRFSSIVLFLIVILLSYTRIFPPGAMFITGFLVFGGMYLIRITRLFLIFMKRNFSILYLILYLCALEFLPVLVLLKYFTGLF